MNELNDNANNMGIKINFGESAKWQSYVEIPGSVSVVNNEYVQTIIDKYRGSLFNRRFFIEENIILFTELLNSMPITHIDNSMQFFRARIGCFTKLEDLGAPEPSAKVIGRLNPRGVSFLYVSDILETAVSELRPWLGATVSIAKCRPCKPLHLLDFTQTRTDDKNENDFRRIINENFSKPVNPNEVDLEYLFTQSVAEYIKLHKFNKINIDGIKYLSAVKKGNYNIAIFDPDQMQVEYLKQVKITKTQYCFK